MVRVRGGDKWGRLLTEMGNRLAGRDTVQVGFLEGATYPDGTSVPMVAAIHEYGAPKAGIPARPFFRGMVRERSPDWPRQIAANLKANNYDAEKSLEQVGAAVKGQLQTAITQYVGPPLADSTVARKGHDKQLVDTKNMLHSVDYVVKKRS